MALPGWNARYLLLALGAVAVLPIATLSPQGVTPLGAVVAGSALLLAVRDGTWTALARWPLTWVLVLLFLWSGASVSWSIVPGQSLRLVVPLALLILGSLVYLLAAGALGPQKARQIGRWWLAGFAASAAFLAFESLLDFPVTRVVLEWMEGDPGTGPANPRKIYDPAMGVLLMSAWPLTLVMGGRVLRWLPLAVAAVLVVFGLNVTAKIALLLAVVAYGLCVWMPRAVTVATVGLCVIAVVAAPVMFSLVDPEGTWGLALADLKLSGQHRLYIWNFVSERIAERPLLGWGLDSSAAIPGGDVEVLPNATILPLHPHNIGLQLWLELGPLGAIAGAAVLLLSGRALLRLGPPSLAVGLALFITIFTESSLSYGIWQNWWWAAQAIIVALAWTQMENYGGEQALPSSGSAGAGAP